MFLNSHPKIQELAYLDPKSKIQRFFFFYINQLFGKDITYNVKNVHVFLKGKIKNFAKKVLIRNIMNTFFCFEGPYRNIAI